MARVSAWSLTGRSALWAAVFLAAHPGATVAVAGAAQTPQNPAAYVNPFVGTSGGGNTFPGPVAPGGMIALGPDTVASASPPTGSAQPSGYDYGSSQLRGFSLDRMSGAGCAEFGDVPITPTTAAVTASPVSSPTSTDINSSYFSSFSHTEERASPGFYSVALHPASGPGPIGAELTTASRSAMARFSFPASAGSSTLIFNAAGSPTGNQAASVALDPARNLVTGSSSSGGFCASPDHYTVYFAARVDRPFAAYGTWRRQTLHPGSTSDADTGVNQPVASYLWHSYPRAQTGAYVSLDTRHVHTVTLEVATSYVSVAGAERNLRAEIGQQSFGQIRARASSEWNRALSAVEIAGGSAVQRRRFYTALYQALIEPSVFSDVDGRYIGMDGSIHTAAGYVQYANFSGWDIYRTQIPLLAMLRPAEAESIARSFIADAQQSGWLPKWSVANFQTAVMNGDSADPILADTYNFGATRFDARAALAQMIHGATDPGRSQNDCYVERQQLTWYERLGYIPHEFDGGLIAVPEANGACTLGVPANADGGSTALLYGEAAATLEYASDDFAISRLAATLGNGPACRAFLHRSGSWQTLWNSTDRYLEPRYADGSWVPGYDPNANDSASATSGFTEGDSAQYTWMVPFDYHRLSTLMGDDRTARRRLDTFFGQLNSGQTGPYAYLGNEPSLETPWVYDWLGAPYETQRVVRQALTTLYTDTPRGLPGNDDLGTMSAWYVLGAIGLYPEIPGSDVLALSSPLFPGITLHLAHGDLVIRAPGAPDKAYIHGLRLNRRAEPRPWLHFASLAHGATLSYALTPNPDHPWGSSKALAPPSYAPDASGGCPR